MNSELEQLITQIDRKLNNFYNQTDNQYINDLKPYFEPIQQRISQTFLAVDDPDVIESLLSMFFAELKAHWLNLNNTIQYQTFFGNGTIDPPVLTFRSTGLSLIIDEIQKLLPEHKSTTVSQFLMQNSTGTDASEPYAVVEIDQIVLQGKRKIFIHRSAK